MAPHLLVVDDESDICELIADVASDRGFEVTTISDADQVADVLTEKKPDLLLLDLMMPGTDGVELLRIIAEKSKNTKVCLMSGHDARVLASAKRLGTAHGLDVFSTFEKPIDIAVLRQTLDQFSGQTTAPTDTLDVMKAIATHQLIVHYQPYVSITTREVYGMEALVRWNHPQRGLLQPCDFIDHVASSGTMTPLTDFMLNAAIEEAGRWHARGEKLVVGINVTASTLLDLTLPDRLLGICRIHNLPPNALILEVTENEAMSDTKRTMDVLLRLRLKDFNVAIDDFGTGHSSLRELQRMPFSEIKIDKGFVLDMAANKDSQIIVNTIIDLGLNLGLKVVAEGVEDARTWQMLADKKCDLVQGFLVSKALPAHELPSWLKAWRLKPTV